MIYTQVKPSGAAWIKLETLQGESTRYKYVCVLSLKFSLLNVIESDLKKDGHTVLVLQEDQQFDRDKTFKQGIQELDDDVKCLELPNKMTFRQFMVKLETQFGLIIKQDEAHHEITWLR